MATDLERLIVSLDADITRLSKQMARATGDVDAFAKKADASSRRAAKAINDNLQQGLRDDQLKNLGFQAQDIFASLGSGAPLLQVLAQQGGQVYSALADTPGGAAAGVKDLASRFAGLLTPARLVAGGVATIGVSAALLGMRWEDAQEKIELGLSGVGKASGITVRQINEVSAAAAASGRITASAAREAATAIAATGKVDASNLPGLVGLVPGYAKLFGKDVTEAGADLARIFADPVKGADELDARLGILDDRTRQYIRTLAAQGDRQGAIRVLAQTAQPALEQAAAKTSLWARAWNSVEAAADAAGQAVNRATSGGSLDDRAREAERRRAAADAAANRSGNVNPVDPAYVDELRGRGLTEAQIRAEVSPVAPGAVDNAKALSRALGDATAEAERLEEEARRLGAQRFNDTMNAQAREISKTAGEATRALNAEGEALQNLEDRYVALGSALDNNRARGMLDDADKTKASVDALGQRLQQLRADYAAGGAAAASAARAANFQQATAGLSAYARGLMEVNQRFDDLRRNAIATTDAARLPDALRTIESARGAATAAFNRETEDRAKSEVRVSPDIARIVIGAEGNNAAKNPLSSASGFGQFIDPTFLNLYKKEFSNLASGMSDAAILGLKQDRAVNERLIEAYARENAVLLNRAGFDGGKVENQYLAHFLGGPGALAALRADRSANAEEVLGSAAARANPTIIGGGRTVGSVIDYAYGRAQRFSGPGVASQDRARQIQEETTRYGAAADAAAKLDAVERLLAEDRKQGGPLSREFATATDLVAGSSAKLTPELAAQRAEWLKLADAEAAAVRGREQSRLKLDLTEAYGALGRTPGEQQDYLQARRFGAEGSAEFQGAYDQLSRLRDLTEAKSTGSGFVKDLAYDLQRGVGFAEALSGALSRITSRFLDKGIDALFNAGFGGGDGGGLGSVVSAIGTAITGGSAIPRFATGGAVVGAGTGTSDSIPAMLSNGEFIVNSRAARANLPLLRAINSGRARGYAAGGVVGAVGAMPVPIVARPAAASRPNLTYRGGDTHITAPGADANAIAGLRGYIDAARAEDRRLIGQHLASWRENN